MSHGDPPPRSLSDEVQLPSSAVNFRDFGHLKSRHGGWIQPCRLYRSGHMAALEAEDVRRLQALDFQLVADLRYAEERAEQPSPWPQCIIGTQIYGSARGRSFGGQPQRHAAVRIEHERI